MSLPKDWIGSPTLTGERVILTPLASADAQALSVTIDDPAAFAWTPVPIGLDATEEFIQRALETADRLAFAVTDRRTGDIVGTTSFYDILPEGRSLAVGFTWYSSATQGGGVNPDAKFLLLHHAFETVGAVRVVWHTDERNAQSRAAILKLGTTFEGLLRKQKPAVDGGWRTTAQYSMIDDDWPACRTRLLARITP